MTTARLSLPPNPEACLPLYDEDFARLKRRDDQLWRNPHPCKTCGDKGWFRRREPDGSIAEYDCPCEEQWLLHLWLLNAGIGMAYQRLSLRDVPSERTKSVYAALQYIDQIEANLHLGRGLVLWSELKGTGKTLSATLVLKSVLEAGYDGFFTTFPDMLDMYQSTWRDKEERAWFDRRVRNVQFLVIDDIGKEGQQRSRDVSESMVDLVLRARNAAALPTIITTNRTPEEMDQGYSVASLLSGTFQAVEINGADYRDIQNDEAKRDASDGVRRPVVML